MGKTAIIFPGQGAQVVGMGKDVADAFPAARAVFDDADRLLGYSLSGLCFDGPAERLNGTDISQPAIFVCSVAIWKALESTGAAARFAATAMAGLSLGEYTALHLAGWFDFEEGLRLVAERGRLMQAAAEAVPSGMVSVLGLDPVQVDELCRQAAAGEVLVAANFNCPGQVVISGAAGACHRAVELAEGLGGRGVPLSVAGAFHSPLMAPAVEGLKKALSCTTIRPGRIGVVSNVSAAYHAGPEGVRDLLCQQVAMPTRWQASIEALVREGYDRFVEAGPGKVLTGLMRKIDRTVKTVNFSTASSLNQPAAGS